MLHRLAQLLMAHPRLVGAHAMAYADLAVVDLQALGAQVLKRALLMAAAACASAIALVLAGVAWMLWSAGLPLPTGPLRLPLAYIAAPSLALLVALGCAWALWRGERPQALRRVRAEWARDRSLLQARETSP